MKIEKLPSGSYRVRQQYDKKRYSLVFDHKPALKEINIELSKKIAAESVKTPNKGSIGEKAGEYIKNKKNDGKSPTTINSYKSIINNTPQWFLDMDVSAIAGSDIEKLINEYFSNHSAKSTRNMHSFWRCVIAENVPTFNCSVKLPTTQKKHEYEPSTKDIKRILEYSKGTRYYLVLRLASLGLRRGEACAITSDDLNEENVLTINKDMIVDENRNQVIKKTPKTDASNRKILIPADIADMIRDQESVFEGNMHTINEYLHKAQDALGIPRFRLHIMRHFAAAYMLKNKFSVVEIEDYMGWQHGSSTMQKVYAYNLDPEDSQKNIASIFQELS